MFSNTAPTPAEPKKTSRPAGGRVKAETRAENLVPAMPTPAPSAGAASEMPPGTDEVIRNRAYQLWEAAGRPDGDGIAFWTQAEAEMSSGG